jgi:hypothetical protein
MKQLATQGLDPSIYTSNNSGAINLYGQLNDLNNAINTVANSSTFSGINLLASGPVISKAGSYVYPGLTIDQSALTVSGLLSSTKQFTDNGTQYSIDLASFNLKNHHLPGTYEIYSDGSNTLTLNYTINNAVYQDTAVVRSQWMHPIQPCLKRSVFLKQI